MSHRSLPAKRGYVLIEGSRVPDWLPLPDLRAVVVPVGQRAKEGSIDIHVDRFGLDLIHSPSSVGVFEAEVAT